MKVEFKTIEIIDNEQHVSTEIIEVRTRQEALDKANEMILCGHKRVYFTFMDYGRSYNDVTYDKIE